MLTRLCLALIASTVLLCAGCASISSKVEKAEEGLVIPTHPTAQSQYGFAKVYHNSQLISPEVERRKIQMARIGAAYEKVVTNFPGDQQFTPLAMMELGDCAAQADDYNRARNHYAQARTAFPGNEYVQARTLYSEGKLLDSEGKYVESKAIYKQVMDKYGKSETVRVRDVAQRAAGLYYQVRDAAQAPKGSAKKGIF